MKYVMIFRLILTTIEIFLAKCRAEIFYVLPDNATDTVSCPSQPCATLSQHLLDNHTLPALSNAEYRFLPGEHYVPDIMILQNLCNISIIGIVSKPSSLVVLVGYQQRYVINIVDSHFVIIKNVKFKNCRANEDESIVNLRMLCCFSCKIVNVTFLYYGLEGYNLIGKSYLDNINIETIRHTQLCCQAIYVRYTICPLWKNYVNHTHNLTINQLFIHKSYLTPNKLAILKNFRGNNRNTGIYISLDLSPYFVNILLNNSHFSAVDREALRIKTSYIHTAMQMSITNCIFKSVASALGIFVSPYNKNVSFVNCKFLGNILVYNAYLIGIYVKGENGKAINSNMTNITFIRCQFYNNIGGLLVIDNAAAPFSHVNVLIESLNISHNKFKYVKDTNDVILISNMNVHVKGPINVIGNDASKSVLQFHSCDILFSGEIIFDLNNCAQLILLNSYIKVMEYANIAFVNNRHQNNIIEVENAKGLYQPYPFCLFQYVAVNGNRTTTDLLSHYHITFIHNHLAHFNGSRISSESRNCSITVCYYLSHCKWLTLAAFHGYSPGIINKQIISSDDHNCSYHKHICHCSQSEKVNCSIDELGPVYPGQTLQTNLCSVCNDDVSTVLYAEVNNINLPSSSCKIVHHSQLINLIGNHSNTVEYTIASSTSDNDKCELFLTVSPYLNIIYNAFYVKLLPCPMGFTLQNGVCNCDPILSAEFYNCHIEDSTIVRPANTWITADQTQENNTKYLISNCPIDYCLPYTSNINLAHPSLQCQFNRTGVLCSQCEHDLSMVFGSSRCMECTNVHILITIIVIAAGIVLVVLLYLLNLTVTTGTINGIIFYANVVSINNYIFLVNDNNVFKSLRVFISFLNLDLGIETCYYNGMDSYFKTWLQLFFPLYLIIIAISIIIASRYSYRILRLTYKRSLSVLATLFLLSYTGVLRTVLTVLFSYSTITHLPSGHHQIVWSIDASVPLFGLKFTILFIVCLVLFLLLIPFNIILLIRYLLQFRIISHFKPLLDAFQGCYKDKYYYWVAVHITLRSIFFCLYGLQTKMRLTITTMILVLFTGCHGYFHPNKNKMVDFQELLLLINLTMMYGVSYHSNESVFSVVTNIMISLALIQFCIIALYHFFTYTCHFNTATIFQAIKETMINKKTKWQDLNSIKLLKIPERTYNYTEYQDGLISEDFSQ